MHYRMAEYVLWLLTPTLQACMLFAMYRRGLHRGYPFFFAYTILQVASSAVLAAFLSSSYTVYYYAYFVNLTLSIAVSFAVVWEILRTAFGRSSRSSVPTLALLAVALIASFAAVLTLSLTSAPGAERYLTKLLMMADTFLRISQLGVLLVLLVLGTILGVSRRNFVYGVGLGFGVFAVVNLVVSSTVRHHAMAFSVTLSVVNSVGYLSACIIWLGYAIWGSTDAGSFGRVPLAPSLLERRRDLNPPSRWMSWIGSLQGRIATGN